MKQVALIVSTVLALMGTAISEARADFDAAAVFSMRCASCHTVGRGDDIGPDLAGVTERRQRDWLVSFIQSSQRVIRSEDPVALELFERFGRQKMPDHDYTPEQIDQLLDLIASGGPGEPEPAIRPAIDATPEEVARGRDLFFGRERLANGGASCATCHSVGQVGWAGGSLSNDLTDVYSRYYDIELTRTLEHPDQPLMAELYGAQPLTPEECFALKAFLYQVDREGSPEDLFPRTFALLGFASGALFLGLVGVARRNREWRAEPAENR